MKNSIQEYRGDRAERQPRRPGPRFAEKGFDAATNKDIARAAGITPGLIYHYFRSKRDVLVEAMELHSPVKAMRSVTPEMLALPPEDFLPRLLLQLLEVLEGDEFLSMLRVFLPEAIHKGAMSPSVFSAMAEATGFLQQYLDDRMKAGQLRAADAALTSHLVLGSLMDLVLRRRVIKDRAVLRFSRQQIVDHVVSTTLEGTAAAVRARRSAPALTGRSINGAGPPFTRAGRSPVPMEVRICTPFLLCWSSRSYSTARSQVPASTRRW